MSYTDQDAFDAANDLLRRTMDLLDDCAQGGESLLEDDQVQELIQALRSVSESEAPQVASATSDAQRA